MQADSATRILLAGILLCLVLLVVRGFGAQDDQVRGRYVVTGMRAGAPVLIRTDTMTGKVWKLEVRGGGDRWVEFAEPSDDPTEAAHREPTPREAADPVETGVVDRELLEPPGAPAIDEPPPAPMPAGNLDEDIATYLQALRNPELPSDVRVWAAVQLGRIDDPRALEALLESASATEPDVAMAVLASLAARDDPRVRPALEAARSHPDARVQRFAGQQLSELDGS